MLQTLSWQDPAVRLLDQTRLPQAAVYVDVLNEKQMHDAIRRLVVRGAPAIGVAAAFGVYLGIREHRGSELLPFYTRLNEVCDYLATSRPTAVNLFWAIDRIRRVARDMGRSPAAASLADAVPLIKQRILSECLTMLDEDRRACRAIGEHGLRLLQEIKNQKAKTRNDPIRLLTHCNAGALATVAYGTALAPIYVGLEQGIRFEVFADETRPLLQGSRITAFELQAAGVPVTVITDSTAATVLRDGLVDAVIVGADRIAANGDTANKIGTLPLAIVANYYKVPFFVAAPMSTIDGSLPDGSQIPIEERHAAEITHSFNHQTAPDGVDVFNPAFDITPANLITAIITEKGILVPPYAKSIHAAQIGIP